MKSGMCWAVMVVVGMASAGVDAGSVGMNGGQGVVLDDPPIAIDAGWDASAATPPAFYWGAGSNAPNLEGPYTFHASGPVILLVTDAFLRGDRFEVFDFGISLGLTSLPAGGGSPLTDNPNVAFGNPDYSFGSFGLGAGDHAITFATVDNPHGGGRGYLRVDTDRRTTSVPDSGSSLAMAAFGGVALMGARRRWSNRRA